MFLVRTAAAALGKDVLFKDEVQVPDSREGESFWARWFNRPQARYVRVEYAKRLIRLTARQYNVPLPKVAVRFTHLGSAAGRIKYANGMWYIDLCTQVMTDDERLLSVVAHEMAHHVLALKQVQLEPLQRNEELTDVAAVLAGFGKVMKRSKLRRSKFDDGVFTHEVHSTIGYLPVEDIRRLSRARRYLRRRKVRSRWRDVVSSDLVGCWFCGTQLRTPNLVARITVTCPRCSAAQELGLVPEENLGDKVWRWIDATRGLP